MYVINEIMSSDGFLHNKLDWKQYNLFYTYTQPLMVKPVYNASHSIANLILVSLVLIDLQIIIIFKMIIFFGAYNIESII